MKEIDEYKSYICRNCPAREQYAQRHQCVKNVTRHICQDYFEQTEGSNIHRLAKKPTHYVL